MEIVFTLANSDYEDSDKMPVCNISSGSLLFAKVPLTHLPKPYIKKFSNLKYPLGFCSETFELQHKISNNVVCATSKAPDQPPQIIRRLIRAFAGHLNIL